MSLFGKATSERRTSRFKKKMRIRKKIAGTTERPRFTVFKSLRHMYVQLIDDTVGRTLLSSSSLDKDFKDDRGDIAVSLGALVAKKAKEKNISTVVFDRNGYKYHGNLKKLADAARGEGLKF